jgi:hypothetical protein
MLLGHFLMESFKEDVCVPILPVSAYATIVRRRLVDIRHPADVDQELYLYDKDIRVCRLKFVDKRQNARTFKPHQAHSAICYANGRVQP